MIGTITADSMHASFYELPLRGYKLKLIDGFGRFPTQWYGGDTFAGATTVRPIIDGTTYVPEIVVHGLVRDPSGPGAVVSKTPPKISGTAIAGRTLTSTTGTWSSSDVSLTRQWLRNGVAIAGATRSSYKLAAADVGRRISLRVTARRGDESPVAATSSSTAAVGRASARISTSVTRLKNRRVRLSVVVRADGLVPTGRVAVWRGGKVVASWRSLSAGRRTLTLGRQPKGSHRYTVRYGGSSAVKPTSAYTKRLRIR